jgi:hypothetical protein
VPLSYSICVAQRASLSPAVLYEGVVDSVEGVVDSVEGVVDSEHCAAVSLSRCDIVYLCPVPLPPTRRWVLLSRKHYKGDANGDAYKHHYAELHTAGSTALGTASSTADKHTHLTKSHGRRPHQNRYKHCQGTCQAGVCALSPFKQAKCFEY